VTKPENYVGRVPTYCAAIHLKIEHVVYSCSGERSKQFVFCTFWFPSLESVTHGRLE